MEPAADRLPFDEPPEALSITALYRQVQAAVTSAFPRGHQQWVRGEIQSISDRTGHCYIDLVDPDAGRGRDAAVLKVNCWGRTWGPLKATLAGQGIALEPGMVVVLRGRVEFYAPKAQINFIAAELDVSALLGRMAARRAALLKALEDEGLLRRNKERRLGPVPLRVALVASSKSEGFKDFQGQLRTSPWDFAVVLYEANVQGAGAPPSITRALTAASASDNDLVVLVRGGGSRADLAAFDHELVARAVATSALPVWTGIGHTGDQSLADIVAHQAFVTPTECGQELVRLVAQWWSSVAESAARVGRLAGGALDAAAQRDAAARSLLVSATHSQLHRHAHRLRTRASALVVAPRRQLAAAGSAVERRATRLGASAGVAVDRHQDRVTSWRRLLAAYDVERQLQRGYTITLGPDGAVVRSVAELAPGRPVVTRFADGTAASVVETVTPAPAPPAPAGAGGEEAS
ncbi:MAG TPA: exodeoxyribonuclease VII large subunit [Acidimicrobiales bacterium]|nr:exodeoxyribonuclease VII large subunit [Acidimicrobiales bacterium]